MYSLTQWVFAFPFSIQPLDFRAACLPPDGMSAFYSDAFLGLAAGYSPFHSVQQLLFLFLLFFSSVVSTSGLLDKPYGRPEGGLR